MPSKQQLDDLPDLPEQRFSLEDCLAHGVCGEVHIARDAQQNNRRVAVKMLRISRANTLQTIRQEIRVLQDFGTHPNIPDFFGAFHRRPVEVWLAMELCEGGCVLDLVNSLLARNRRMSEEHIAFILKETVKAIIHLHEHRVMHRDIRASNILLTGNGDVKLADFGLARHLSSTFGKSDTRVGSPCWMAPEVVASTPKVKESGYGNRADVWALGITAIELGDGHPPFAHMHPTRAMFQIVRNPPPTLYRPSNWDTTYNDFIAECLEKNAEHRPFIQEIIEHPFLGQIPENSHHLCAELKQLVAERRDDERAPSNDTLVMSDCFKKTRDEEMQRMHVEDLAALDQIHEDSVLHELHARMQMGQFHTFIGNVLLILNPNAAQDIYGVQHHKRHMFKSRSDNAPHIFAMADSAFQDALHQSIPQNIVLGGESGSGKTTNFLHLLDHLLFIGNNDNINSNRIRNAMDLIHGFTHASTPFNDSSTRCMLKTELTFGRTGKVSGAIFFMHQLEKSRVSSTDMLQSNFHMMYYFYDAMAAKGQLEKYHLRDGRAHRFLRVPADGDTSSAKPRDCPARNAEMWDKLSNVYAMFQFEEPQIEMVKRVLAAILLIGDIRFKQTDDDNIAEIDNVDVAEHVADLLETDEKKLPWSLTNYCLIKKGTAVRRRHTCDEARDARDVFANTLYNRLVDYVINVLNHKLAYGRTIFGEKYSVRILDIYGFECFKENQLTQLFINCFNEQLQYHFVQRVFAWETMEMSEENVPFTPFNFYDNKPTLDEILGKPDGLLSLIDDASRMASSGEYILDYLKTPERQHISVTSPQEFSISHYTGRVIYNVKEMPDRNRDFLPPEVIETMRLSHNKYIKNLFTGKLTRTGNLYTSFEEPLLRNKSKIRASSSSEDDTPKLDRERHFSQVKKMRTAVSTFRSLCLDLLKELSVGGSAGGTHFVRCIRSDLAGQPNAFHAEIVKQQLRALAIVDTARARQRGFPHRIPFSEFLRRYKFLAFDFNETVEVSKENCRLLLVRLKMEGWMIGKSKVFLKYYNEEYLARLYETQVKKIIKIQSMMRGFLAKLNVRKRQAGGSNWSNEESEEDKAARVLQKAYRVAASRKAYGPLVSTQLDRPTCKFIRFYADRWKAKTLFQVLLQYRAARYQDLFNLSQQVHLFNQQAVYNLQKCNLCIDLGSIDQRADAFDWLGKIKPSVLKLPLTLLDIHFYDTSFMCDPNAGMTLDEEEDWDFPLRYRENMSLQITRSMKERESKTDTTKTHLKNMRNQSVHKPIDSLTNLPFSRDPNETVHTMSASSEAIHEKVDKVNIFDGGKLRRTGESSRVNPVAELQSKGRQNSSEDEPPFNFQAMLRKTKTIRDSMRRSSNSTHNNDGNAWIKRSFDVNDTQTLQLAPGIVMEGVVVDL